MLQIAKGVIRAVKAIKDVDPDSIMFHVEATGLTRTIREDLASLAREETHRGYVCFDLVTGKLSHDHLLFSWLLRSGAPLDDLLQLQESAITLDVIGENFYLELGLYRLDREAAGRRWISTSLVDEFQKYVRSPSTAVGDMKAQNASAHS